MQLQARDGRLVYTCVACGNEWAERRLSRAMASEFSTDDAHTAVQEICAARLLEDIMAVTRRWARRLTRADGVTFVLRSGDMCYYADEEAIEPLWKGQRFPLHDCVSGWVILNAQPVIIPDIYADPRVPHAVYRQTFVRSLLMVPVRKAAPLGALGAYWGTGTLPTPAHVQLLELLAEAAGVGLMSEQLWARASG
jgi:GAF domain-containing protein